MTGILTVITIVGIVCLFCANDSSCNNMKKCWMSIVKKEDEEEPVDAEEEVPAAILERKKTSSVLARSMTRQKTIVGDLPKKKSKTLMERMEEEGRKMI